MTTETPEQPIPAPPTPTAWDTLAWQAREIAELAEQTRDLIAGRDLTELTDELRAVHEKLDEAARAVMPLAAECRRDTFRGLLKSMKVREIAAAFRYNTTQAVYNVLYGPRTPEQKGKGKRRKTPDAGTVRAWALANGLDVAPGGRISKELVDRYKAAQQPARKA